MKTYMLALTVVLSLTLAVEAGAQNKCGSLKMKAAGKKAGMKSACYAKAFAKGFNPDSTCLAKAEIKFSQAFAKAELKLGAECLTTNDAGQLEADLDAWIGDTATALQGDCGNGVIQGGEQCDDGNLVSADGCTNICTILLGYNCTGEPSVCATTCGDGIPAGSESCDDGNAANSDGCSSTCGVEAGFACCGAPSVCTACPNGLIEGCEGCDDNNATDGDGCSQCQVEYGYSCTGEPSVCAPVCGDGIVTGSEQCDDGNTDNGDGCSSTCALE